MSESSAIHSSAAMIIRKVKKVHGGGHHGGSWKVAYADFVTAMMAFFLLLWILEVATPQQKAAIASYFQQPDGIQGPGGASSSVIDMGGRGEAAMPTVASVPIFKDQNAGRASPSQVEPDACHPSKDTERTEPVPLQQAEIIESRLAKLLEVHPDLLVYRSNLKIDATPMGVRVQLVDNNARPLFERGSSRPLPVTEKLLNLLAISVKDWPNRISIAGHTDSVPFSSPEDKREISYSNWELSADRAHAARRFLVDGGISESKIVKVAGFAASMPYDRENPQHPVNRRVSLLFLSTQGEKFLGL